MATYLIIDGYNLLGVRGQVGRVSGSETDQAREQLLRDIAVYRQHRPHAITVVFDGWQQGQAAEHREHRAGLEVVFSRRGERADQVIQRLADRFGGDCAVVSSDREVAEFARARGAFIIGAGEFDTKLRQGTAGKGQRGFRARDENEDDVPRRRVEKKGNPRKLPKALRKRQRRLRGF